MNVSELTPLYETLLTRLNCLESRYQALEEMMQSVSVGILAFSKQGAVTYINRCARQLLDLPHCDVTCYDELFPDDYFGCSMHDLQTAAPCEHRLFLKLGEAIDLEVLATVSSRVITFFLNDRTHSAKLARSLQHNQQLQALGEMAAVLAHEIRNPLGGIEGFASLLHREVGDEAHKQMAWSIITGSRALNSLVTSVLEYAKPLDLHFQAHRLVDIVQECCSWSAGWATYSSSDSEWSLLADKERLKFAFLHLMRNGWEASERCPVHLHVSTGCVTFRDEGKGILPEHLPHLFTPFFTTKTEGTGLGLSEAHKVIRAHGGSLEVSETSEKGTTFTASWQTDPTGISI